ncbi:hypothetical protein [Sphingobium sp. LB126]|uniref:hypothetical protein n=1 Tax=Sphingobium sp. LB126 TaxID=1983755 RepID=UPI001F5B441E|nr:hypothetical protein [Sphingobium sp. LB126]
MIENKLAVPASRATGERVALDVCLDADLAGEMRDHGRGEVRFLIWKTALRPPERQLTGEPQLTGISIASDERNIVGDSVQRSPNSSTDHSRFMHAP